ncbi:MAG: hypothetical protein JNJ94_05265 [Chlorobi bacterium]|nr:hypothetical protein [Chlorobiota bacterium]
MRDTTEISNRTAVRCCCSVRKQNKGKISQQPKPLIWAILMDPFKKSLGINFGPLFSVTVNPSKKEAGLEIDKNKGEKESSPKLQKLRTPGGTPKPDIDVIGGFEVVGWEWVSTSSPLEPGGYWKPVLGWPVEKDIRLPDPPPPGMRFGSGGGSGNTTSQEDEHPCVEKRKEVEERKGGSNY